MNVVVAMASGPGQISGVQRHAINLASCLSRRGDAVVHLIAAPWQSECLAGRGLDTGRRMRVHYASMGQSAAARNLWFYTALPKLAAQLGADIVHLAYPVPVQRRAFRCPTVVTLHDLYPYEIPENFGLRKAWMNRIALRQCLGQVDAIACVSESTLLRFRAVDERMALRKASVIYNSIVSQEGKCLQSPIDEWKGEGFLLCVAQHRRNKNILLALKVFERLLRAGLIGPRTRFVIVGIEGPETRSIHGFVDAAGLTKHVVLLRGIPEGQLQWCYRNCNVLLAPSITEGFGLPVAEARMAGCRIVCSDIPAFRELAGAGCRYARLGKGEVEGFAAAVMESLSEPVPQPMALPQFSPLAIGARYMDLYRSLMAGARATLSRKAFADAGGGQSWI